MDRREQLSPSPHLNKEADPVSETFCFLVFRIVDGGESTNTL
jgi:hypothetical protein